MESRPSPDSNPRSERSPLPDQGSAPGAGVSPPNRPFLDFHARKLLHTAQGKEWLDVRFQLQQGQTLAIYGPSGAGKTTLLRVLAGLTEVHAGHIRLGDETWLDTSARQNRPTRHRAIGFVFQDFALFPNLTVREQLEYALPRLPAATRTSAARMPTAPSHSAVATSSAAGTATTAAPPLIDELLALMELEALQNHRPALLSGGQQQRVALARAIARRPSLLLLDEPLSALDEEMRNKLQEYLAKIQQRYHLTTILVSHHLPEILRLADTAIILKHGQIEKQGPPPALFAAASSYVPQMTPPATILAIRPAGDHVILAVRCADTTLDIPVTPQQAAALAVGQTITVAIMTILPGPEK